MDHETATVLIALITSAATVVVAVLTAYNIGKRAGAANGVNNRGRHSGRHDHWGGSEYDRRDVEESD